jgi:hypothetical protein
MKFLFLFALLSQIPVDPIVPEFRPGKVFPDAPNDAAYAAATYLKSALEAEFKTARPAGYQAHASNLRFISLYNLSTHGSRRKFNSKTGEIEQFSPLDDMTRVLLFVVNQLNRINPPATLIRIKDDLYALHYDSPGWTAESWDSMASEDAYFKREWIEDPTWDYLTAWTYTQYPIMRADQFISISTVPPHYYNLLGLPKTLKEFYDLTIHIDEKFLATNNLINAGVKVDGLTVTLNNRRLEYRPGAFPAFTSHDVINDKGRKNALRQLDVIGGSIHDLDIDGQEHIARNRCGFWIGFLNDAKGNRVDFVPTTIANDENFRDRTVIPGRSCITCHDQGIKSFSSDQAKLLESRVIELRTTQPQDAVALAGRYDEKALQRAITNEQANFRLVIEDIVGTTPEKIAFMYSVLWKQYKEERVGLHQYALECGLSDAGLIALSVPSIDPNLLYLISQPKATLSRGVVEDTFNQVMLLRGKPVAPAGRMPMPAIDPAKIKRVAVAEPEEVTTISKIEIAPAQAIGDTRDTQFTIKTKNPVSIKSYVKSNKVFLSSDQESKTEHVINIRLTAEQDGFAQSVELELSNGKQIKIPIVLK